MTVPHTWALSFVRERAQLYDYEQLQHFCQQLAEHDCYLALDIEIGFTALWQKYHASAQPKARRGSSVSNLKAGVSENLLYALRTYCQQRQELFTFQLYAMATSDLLRGMTCLVTLAPTEGYILLSVDAERFFYGAPPGLAKYRYWSDLLRITYQCWHPLYIHTFNHAGPAEVNPTWEQVQACELLLLSEFGMLGPELVTKLGGEEHFLSAPAWKIERLDDGGMFLVPEPPSYVKTSIDCSYSAVARHLGFTTAEAAPDEVFVVADDSGSKQE
ncbi:hypothetical protein [Dictyobacter aurantiacus]|uniref:Uncharacterized protein n=1 Tax=Dictyobacter aurantiacus TaxID=1936993 RepID=A0A401ZFB9_9CHLR|nr:hypothetical protein [Dictyobacter aurantiacus]GCE05493.1 hypothetical protein KDAU_28220 [Dictyobacter aurantiacus]